MDLLKELWIIFFDMSFYMTIGLLFAGILHLIFSKAWIIKHIGKNNFSSVFKSVLFGVPMPLCSCGVIPTAVYMNQNGASNAAIIAFLISTPQTGIDSIIATYGMMGFIFAIFRPIAAFFMGIFGGLIINLFSKDEMNLKNLYENKSIIDKSLKSKTFFEKLKTIYNYAFVNFLDDISIQFIIGIIIAALISYFFPDEAFLNSKFSSGIFGMLFMIIVGIPIYICATSSIPIALSLMAKGFSPGVAFVFLTAGPVTNIVSLSILLKVFGKKLTSIYLIVIIIFSMIFGGILDFIFKYYSFNSINIMHHNHHSILFSDSLKWIFVLLFIFCLLLSLKRKYLNNMIYRFNKNMIFSDNFIKVDGMSCSHCASNVKNALLSIKGIKTVDINLESKMVKIIGQFDLNDVKIKIEELGYKIK